MLSALYVSALQPALNASFISHLELTLCRERLHPVGMRSKALLIVHRRDEKDDRASAFLAAHGLDLVWSCPAEGDSIPELDDSTKDLIVYGGRYGVPDKRSFPFLGQEMRVLGKALERDIPVLGLCLGAQLLAHELGARVGPHPEGYP